MTGAVSAPTSGAVEEQACAFGDDADGEVSTLYKDAWAMVIKLDMDELRSFKDKVHAGHIMVRAVYRCT